MSNFLDEAGGVDLGCVGNFFTWNNGLEFEDHIRERLDCAVRVINWCLQYPLAGLLGLPMSRSNHLPIILDSFMDRDHALIPFCFIEM